MYKQREQAIPFTSKTKLITLPIIFAIVMIIIVPLIGSVLIELISPSVDGELISVSSTIGMIFNVIISVFIISKASKLKLKDIGLSFTGAFSKILVGIIYGLVAISVVALVINLFGGTETVYNFKPEYLKTILIGLVFFAFQGTYEELVFRGYLMPHFSKKMGIFWSIVLSSIFFTMLHGFNPGMTAIPIANLMLASVVFSLVYYKTGSLWLVGFAHAIWNYSQGFVYGSEVSGITLQETVFKSSPIANTDLISGGSFGFEGSVITSILGVVLIVGIIISVRKNNDKIA